MTDKPSAFVDSYFRYGFGFSQPVHFEGDPVVEPAAETPVDPTTQLTPEAFTLMGLDANLLWCPVKMGKFVTPMAHFAYSFGPQGVVGAPISTTDPFLNQFFDPSHFTVEFRAVTTPKNYSDAFSWAPDELDSFGATIGIDGGTPFGGFFVSDGGSWHESGLDAAFMWYASPLSSKNPLELSAFVLADSFTLPWHIDNGTISGDFGIENSVSVDLKAPTSDLKTEFDAKGANPDDLGTLLSSNLDPHTNIYFKLQPLTIKFGGPVGKLGLFVSVPTLKFSTDFGGSSYGAEAIKQGTSGSIAGSISFGDGTPYDFTKELQKNAVTLSGTYTPAALNQGYTYSSVKPDQSTCDPATDPSCGAGDVSDPTTVLLRNESVSDHWELKLSTVVDLTDIFLANKKSKYSLSFGAGVTLYGGTDPTRTGYWDGSQMRYLPTGAAADDFASAEPSDINLLDSGDWSHKLKFGASLKLKFK